MSYYEECLASFNSLIISDITADEPQQPLILAETSSIHSTLPSFIKGDSPSRTERSVFYISDLHLAHHIIRNYPQGASDSQIKTYIHSIIKDLLSGEIKESLLAFKSPVVLFGGDISSVFSIAELFYQDFITTWESIINDRFVQIMKETAPLFEEYNSIVDQVEEWKRKHPWVQTAKKSLIEYSDRWVPLTIKELIMKRNEIRKKLGEKQLALGFRDSWEDDYKRVLHHKYIYTILGNHELWSFYSFDSCYAAFSKLFNELNITFVEGKCAWLGPQYKLNRMGIDSQEDDQQKIFLNNALIVGCIGFAANNHSFNADQGIYGSALNRIEELEMNKKWRTLLKKALKKSQSEHCALIVLSHTPLKDWIKKTDRFSNCFFFNGHTHRNIAYRGENNTFLFADNQVGYDSKSFHFKKARLYLPRNPFASDPDGYREISCTEYLEFYLFLQESIPGTGFIERQIRQNNAKIFMLKQEEYYAFFLSSTRGLYICNGGLIRKLDFSNSLEHYYKNFKIVINKYITLLSPLRRKQEELSVYIKSFGGSGTIHGTIVDIDFENHVMINIVDGSLVFYNSPVFGIVKTYDNINSLLHNHCSELEKRLIENGNKQLISLGFDESEYTSIDVKNSPYVVSRRVNALQRLFDKQLLRDWNTDFEEIQ